MATHDLTAARLREVLNYDPSSGAFKYAAPRRRIKVGARAGSIDADGYRVLQVDGKKYRCARLAFLFMLGEWPRHQADHINGDRSDDSWSNLRDVLPALNAQNKRKATAKSKTGELGVYQNGSGFMAQCSHNGGAVYLGTFRTVEEAKAVATDARRKTYPGFTL